MDGDEDMTCHDWFFCTKKLSEEAVWDAVRQN